jgi:type VI secretion system ImpM family protein
MSTPHFGHFGKLPWHGDFLRDAPAGAPLELIDSWLAAAPIGPPGQRSAAFDAAGPSLAMVRTRGSWWAMAMFPSQDAVGRRFPFCVLAGLPEAEFGGEAALVPMLWLPFLVRCLQQSARGWPQDQATLRETVKTCVQPVDADGGGRRLVESLADHRVADLWRGTLGTEGDPRRAGVWADLVSLAVEPEAATGLLLRPMAHQLHLPFVLMLQQLLGDSTCAPVLIGMHPGRPGEPPSATILWGRPSAAECLAALWPSMPGAESSRIHDPVLKPGAFGDADEAPEALGDPSMSLRDLLHEVGSATRRHVRRPRPT